MIIDADVHLSPIPGGNRIRVQEALNKMDRAGVDKAVAWLQPPYMRQVDESNAYIYQAMRQHPDRILGFGWADPNLGVEKARDTVKRCIDEYGFYGVKLNGAQNEFRIDDRERSLPVIEEVARTGKLLAFHVGADSIENTHPFRVAKIARQFPETQILVVHMGGAAIPDLADSAIEFARECPNLHLIGSGVRATRVWKAIQKLGSTRVSFGSDTPFAFMHVQVAMYRALLEDVTAQERHDIMAGNIVQLFGLEGS